MAAPHFFVDRSLGGVTVPRLLREAGWDLTTLAEHYGKPADEAVDDVDWLALAGGNGWPVLMKDEKIRYRAAERAAVVDAGVRAFCLASGNLKSADNGRTVHPAPSHDLAARFRRRTRTLGRLPLRGPSH